MAGEGKQCFHLKQKINERNKKPNINDMYNIMEKQ